MRAKSSASAVVDQRKFFHRASRLGRADEIGEIAQAVKTFKIKCRRMDTLHIARNNSGDGITSVASRVESSEATQYRSIPASDLPL
jgi:hypothetical protein